MTNPTPPTQDDVVLALASYFINMAYSAVKMKLPAGAMNKDQYNDCINEAAKELFVPELQPLVQEKIKNLTNNTNYELMFGDRQMMVVIVNLRQHKYAIAAKQAGSRRSMC